MIRDSGISSAISPTPIFSEATIPLPAPSNTKFSRIREKRMTLDIYEHNKWAVHSNGGHHEQTNQVLKLKNLVEYL